MRVKGGRNLYGQSIGILMLDTRFPRVPGDVGNATTYHYPVMFKVVKGAFGKRVVRSSTDPTLLEPFIKGAKELQAEGVKAITTSCGFLSVFQDRIARELETPVFTSTLLLVPMIYRMLGEKKRIGILTANSKALGREHLEGAGITGIPVTIAGMEGEKEFRTSFLENGDTLDPNLVGAESVAVGRRLVRSHPDVGAIVMECTNLVPYSRLIHRAMGLPVFDIVTLTDMVYDAVTVPERFRKDSD
jgi:hypothetical protein